MENWKLIPSTHGVYKASDHGQIKRVEGVVRNNMQGGERKVGGKVLSQKTKSNGYKEVALYVVPMVGRSRYVHRLVAETFLGIIGDSMVINHKDGNKANNHISNLEIVSEKQNMQHSYSVLENKNLLGMIGSKHGMAKINENDVYKIRELHKNGVTPTEISKRFLISFSTVCKVCYRATWKHI